MRGVLWILGLHQHCLELRGHLRDHRSAHPRVAGFARGRLLLCFWEDTAQEIGEDRGVHQCGFVSGLWPGTVACNRISALQTSLFSQDTQT